MESTTSREAEGVFPRSEASYQEVASYATALSSTIRLKIIDLLSTEDLPVQDLVDKIEASQPLVSQHLRVLRNAGIVIAIRAGRQRVYHLEQDKLDTIFEAMQPRTK